MGFASCNIMGVASLTHSSVSQIDRISICLMHIHYFRIYFAIGPHSSVKKKMAAKQARNTQY